MKPIKEFLIVESLLALFLLGYLALELGFWVEGQLMKLGNKAKL